MLVPLVFHNYSTELYYHTHEMGNTFGSNRGGTYTQSNQQHLLVSESEIKYHNH